MVQHGGIPEPAGADVRQLAAVGPARTEHDHDGPDDRAEHRARREGEARCAGRGVQSAQSRELQPPGLHARRRRLWRDLQRPSGSDDSARNEAQLLGVTGFRCLLTRSRSALITLFAAIVNGALGYGFSSITVPLALLFLSNRVLNPALVIIEVPLNAYVLWVNREALPGVWRRVLPDDRRARPRRHASARMMVSSVSPDWLKLYTFIVLLPLILLQAAGFRRPIQAERAAGLVFGSGVGVLYSVTTISGPPLAIALNNQGLAKKEFRAALGLVRLAESSMTGDRYCLRGPVHARRARAGAVDRAERRDRRADWRRAHPADAAETFRRICMSFDAWIVGFGLSKLVHDARRHARERAATSSSPR